jgi:hypothetical protein
MQLTDGRTYAVAAGITAQHHDGALIAGERLSTHLKAECAARNMAVLAALDIPVSELTEAA